MWLTDNFNFPLGWIKNYVVLCYVIWSNELSVWPWTWRQQTNLLAWDFGPRCCITIPSLVTEGLAAEEISFRWTFTGILNLFCDLDLDHNQALQSFHETIHLMMMYHQTKFRCKSISSSDNIFKRHISKILSLTVTLILKTANQSFWTTVWLMMMHHHTEFSSKRFSDSEDIAQTNSH